MSDLYEHAVLVATTGQAGGGVRLPDGRALSWAEYGSTRGMPCLLLPDTGSSRLAPHWLMHETTPPAEVRLLALDRPGIGNSDLVGLGGQEDPVEDLYHLVSTLAVGRVAFIGVGGGASDALAFAARYPAMLSTVLAISPRMTAEPAPRHPRWRRPSWSAATSPVGPVGAWLRAAGPGRRPDRRADLGTCRPPDGPTLGPGTWSSLAEPRLPARIGRRFEPGGRILDRPNRAAPTAGLETAAPLPGAGANLAWPRRDRHHPGPRPRYRRPAQLSSDDRRRLLSVVRKLATDP